MPIKLDLTPHKKEMANALAESILLCKVDTAKLTYDGEPQSVEFWETLAIDILTSNTVNADEILKGVFAPCQK